VASKVHVVKDGVVDSFDTVSVVVGKKRIIGSLDIFVDDAINYAQVGELKGLA
jgi:hypothetical protein